LNLRWVTSNSKVRRCVPKVLSVPRNFCQAVYTITLTLVSCFGPPTA
jgi:hypothetical protein